MMNLKHLIRAIKKAIADTETIVDSIDLKRYNEEFEKCLNVSDPHDRLHKLNLLLDEVAPTNYDY